MPTISGTFLVEAHVRRFAIDKMDVATLAVDVRTTDDEVEPGGTVVAVWGQAEAFEDEFDDSFTGLAAVDRDMICQHRRYA